MEPWLDSLSEDWQSEHNSSSFSLPNPTSECPRPRSVASNASQSRIPHLVPNHRKSSTTAKYLRSRSVRGTAPLKGSSVLLEQNPSKLNVAAQQSEASAFEPPGKLCPTTLPRRASSALSESAQSVQHYTLHNRSTRALDDDDIPEWKRRLVRGEDVAGDGCDLFAPSRLEGMFKAPPAPQDENQSPPSPSFDRQRLWSIPSAPPATSKANQSQSMRESETRRPPLDIVEEVNEDGETTNTHSGRGEGRNPTVSPCVALKQPVNSFELANTLRSQASGSQSSISGSRDDAGPNCPYRNPRMRTLSEQEELRNEFISPVTLSKQNTIRDGARQDSSNKSTEVFEAKLEQLDINDFQRPLSSSSNQGVNFGHSRSSIDKALPDNLGADLTSRSLPDDLSMGTQDFISHGGFVNKRRGGFSNEGSFHRRSLSPSAASSRGASRQITSSPPHSSPLLPAAISQPSRNTRPPRATSPKTPLSSERRHHNEQPSRASPLKLFGNRDTYTNNKLLRVLSHFEDEDPVGDAQLTYRKSGNNREEVELRMSQFGEGELDRYDFIELVKLKTRDDAEGGDPRSQLFPDLAHFNSSHPAARLSQTVSSEQVKDQYDASLVSAHDQGSHKVDDVGIDQMKRNPPSPLKERTPKRRRTLHRQEIEVHLLRKPEDELIVPRSSSAKLAGMKRKDARYDDAITTIDPQTLAGRQMLRPRIAHRRTPDTVSDNKGCVPRGTEDHASANPGPVAVREAVAKELVHVAKDARKTSVTTQDYMEEATKIMQMIRSNRRPKRSLNGVEEPVNESELDTHATLDPDVDEISSGDEFSRPPSRNGGRELLGRRRQQHHDPRIASHLRKFQESDDLELLIDTSVLKPTPAPDNAQAEEDALVRIPKDEQQSSPPNIRIHDHIDVELRRKHAASAMEGQHVSQRDAAMSTQSSSESSTQKAISTSSTNSSGRRGVINPGRVHIPDHVGAMTFDHATKTWVKERTAGRPATARRANEEDPFEDIPDLSTEELRGAERNHEYQASDVFQGPTTGASSSIGHASPARPNPEGVETNVAAALTGKVSPTNTRAQLIEHEKLIHNGGVSRAPDTPNPNSKQARVVTIAFSSPLVSAVAYQDDLSTSDEELNLTASVSDGFQEQGDSRNDVVATNGRLKQVDATSLHSASNSRSWPGQSFVGRPVSRIDEQDEGAPDEDMSLIPIGKSQAMTPVTHPSDGAFDVPRTAGKASSIICLTPLSDFSLHQVDKRSHEEPSFVAPRSHPAALRQAHGSLALGVDDMMRAVTDVEPSEPYWDQIRRLDLTDKRLTTLHRLEEYCPTLEELTISANELGQVSGLPLSVRILDVQRNHLSNMTCWSHLQNLQYLNISHNGLESLEGLSCLYHLRELNANDNKIRDIDGILDLNGLQSLTLQGNNLENLDFEGGELVRLKRLDASRNRLAHVYNLSCLPALEELNLEQNNISAVATSDSGPLVSLRHLRMSTNRLRGIDLSGCPNIESLYLDRNSITEIRGLDRACHLHTLSAREQIDSSDIISHVLSTPNDCRKIFLSSNSVPNGKLRLPSQPLFSVRYLELASCGISSIPAGFGTRIPNCRVLNLNFNALGCISQLQGIFNLNKLLLAGNRLERLRRSCLGLSRHPALTKVDLRNNPLTVGFYSPTPVDNRLVAHPSSQSALPVLQDQYTLPRQNKELDLKWVRLLDEGTRLRRRTIELLLAQKCVDLVDLDGLAFDRDDVLQPDELWVALTELGVLKRPMLPPGHEEDIPLQKDVQTRTLGEERGVTIE